MLGSTGAKQVSRTIDQLWAEPIYAPVFPTIKAVHDVAHDARMEKVKHYDWGTKLSDAYIEMRRIATTRNPMYIPKMNGKWDELRFKLHRNLLKWKVII